MYWKIYKIGKLVLIQYAQDVIQGETTPSFVLEVKTRDLNLKDLSFKTF